jgi:uncharacterized SAM-binding protein YcdF (DUF218 family)
MSTLTLQHAKRLWGYLSSFRQHAPCDVIIVCCSYDLRVCDHACALLKSGLAERLLITGKTGNWTRHLWDRPEAEVFFERAKVNGVEDSLVIIEDQATNFGENISLSRRLMPYASKVTFVTKPNSVLRVALTVPVQWSSIAAYVDCPVVDFPDEISNNIGFFGAIDEMVGDVHRIIEYPRLGFQIPHDLPLDVIESWRYLIAQGFKSHLLPNSSIERVTS